MQLRNTAGRQAAACAAASAFLKNRQTHRLGHSHASLPFNILHLGQGVDKQTHIRLQFPQLWTCTGSRLGHKVRSSFGQAFTSTASCGSQLGGCWM